MFPLETSFHDRIQESNARVIRLLVSGETFPWKCRNVALPHFTPLKRNYQTLILAIKIATGQSGGARVVMGSPALWKNLGDDA